MFKILAGIAGAFLAIGLAWGAWGLYGAEAALWALGPGTDPARSAMWGDSFGPFSALFSALGFASVIITLWIQQGQIKEAQKDQHRQQFESSFFELLHLLREARRQVLFRYTKEYCEAAGLPALRSKVEHTGEEAFRAAVVEMQFWWKQETPDRKMASLVGIYRKRFHSRFESKLGPYYRLLYTILDRISDDKVLSRVEKDQYGNLVRSQLTSHEAAAAGINALAPFAKDLPRLIEEFRLLKYVTHPVSKQMLLQHYRVKAFRSRGQAKPSGSGLFSRFQKGSRT